MKTAYLPSKWKGRGDKTVMVLHFSGEPGGRDPDTPHRAQNVTYLRKCRSQVNRDQKRAENDWAHKLKASVCKKRAPLADLFLPKPLSLYYNFSSTMFHPRHVSSAHQPSKHRVRRLTPHVQHEVERRQTVNLQGQSPPTFSVLC